MHQSASAAELAAQAREAEQQEHQQDQAEPNTIPNPNPAAAPKQKSSAQAETANREQAKDGASRTSGTDSGLKPAPGRDAAVKPSSKDGGARAGAKDAVGSGKGMSREAAGAAKAPGRMQPEARQEVGQHTHPVQIRLGATCTQTVTMSGGSYSVRHGLHGWSGCNASACMTSHRSHHVSSSTNTLSPAIASTLQRSQACSRSKANSFSAPSSVTAKSSFCTRHQV